MDNHEFCRGVYKNTYRNAPKKVRALFTKRNVGVTTSGKQRCVELVKNHLGFREVFWEKECCNAAAKAKVIDRLVARIERETHPADLFCPRCGDRTLGKIEECHRDAYEVKSSYSCNNCDNEDIVYLFTPLHTTPTEGE